MAVHREESRFVIRVELSAEFPEDYEGDDDGYAWLEAWREQVKPRLARAVFAELRSQSRFRALPASRGSDPETTLEITVEFQPAGTSG